MNTNEFQQRIKQFYKENGYLDANHFISISILAEKTGEVARIIREIEYDSHPLTTTINSIKTNKKLLSEKLGDVLGMITCIANQQDINLQDLYKEHIEKIEKIHKMMHN